MNIKSRHWKEIDVGGDRFYLTRCHKSSNCDRLSSPRQSPDGHYYCEVHYPTDAEILSLGRMETRIVNISPEYI